MDNEKCIIIDIPFNTEKHPFWNEFFELFKGANQYTQTKEWIDYRIGIFIKYTANSLINQTNQDFYCIVRYSEKTKPLIDEALSKYNKLPENIKFLVDGDEFIKNTIKNYKYFYHVRIDSDNMYEKNYIENLRKIPYYEGLQCILCQNGYVYEENRNMLAEIYHRSPSFYACIYKSEQYLNGYRHKMTNDHWGAYDLTHEVIPIRSYMIIVHGKNISNSFDAIATDAQFSPRMIENNEKEVILEAWNMNKN